MIGIRIQQLNKLCVFCLSLLCFGQGVPVSVVFGGDSLMCLPDKQIGEKMMSTNLSGQLINGLSVVKGKICKYLRGL